VILLRIGGQMPDLKLLNFFWIKRTLKPKKDIDSIISVSDYISQEITEELRKRRSEFLKTLQ